MTSNWFKAIRSYRKMHVAFFNELFIAKNVEEDKTFLNESPGPVYGYALFERENWKIFVPVTSDSDTPTWKLDPDRPIKEYKNGVFSAFLVDEKIEKKILTHFAQTQMDIDTQNDVLNSLVELTRLLQRHMPNWYTRGHDTNAMKAIEQATMRAFPDDLVCNGHLHEWEIRK